MLFERNAEGDHWDSFLHYYVPNIEIKDFNFLTNGKGLFDLPIKNVIYWILLSSKKITH